MSLQQLAILLFQEGDIARAYNYISCSLEDVSFGKARYRIIDIAEYLPIIKAANDSRIKADRDRVLFFLLALSVLVIALVIVFFFLRKKNHNLLKVKKSLAEQNQRLQEVTGNLTRMNEEIKESNHIKEEYIGLLFNICSEYIYKQVVTQLEESQEIQDYAAAYSAMKPKQAAAIFEQMTNNLDLAARILKVMSAEDRGKILGAMNSEVAAKITKIMDPES